LAQLEELESEVLKLGHLVEGGVEESLRIVAERDKRGSDRLIDWDGTVNEKRFELEHEILSLIATQQPVAGDMRILAAMLDIVAELERISDYAKGIARINLLLADRPVEEPVLGLLTRMTVASVAMLRRSLRAFAHRNAAMARDVCFDDDEVDRLFESVFREAIRTAGSEDDTVERANYIVWAAHNLERTADRVTNICERVIYMVTGELVEASGLARTGDASVTDSPAA
jgi:phosphate transport system protein